MLRSVLQSWSHHKGQVLSTTFVLMGVFAICFSFVVIQQNVNRVLTHWGSEFKVNVYISEAADDEQVKEIEGKLQSQEIFRELQFLSKETALEKFRARLGFLGTDLVESGELENPLPASFEATLNTGVAGFLEKLKSLSETLLKDKSIDDISYGQSWVENYSAMVKSFNYMALAVALLLFTGAVLLCSSVIQASVNHRRDEIEIMELFGATRWAISKPFLAEGILLGVIAGVGSVIMVWASYQFLASALSEQLQLWSLETILAFPSLLLGVLYIITCVLVAVLGSYLSVRRISTGWAAAER